MIGCDCAVCRSTDPRDRRTRPSILRRDRCDRRAAGGVGRADVLVDTSTDLRAQALANDIRRVDAILFTHSHADHVIGLDEVRRFNVLQGAAISVLRRRPTLGRSAADLRVHLRRRRPTMGGGIPQLALFRIAGPFTLGGVEIVPVPLLHGRAADSRLPHRRVRVSDRLQSRFPTRRGRCSRACARSSSTRCATGRTRRTSPSPRRSPSSRGSRPRARTSRTSPRSAARGHLRAPARGRGVGI